MVKLSAEALKDAVAQYLFISTVSVYADFEAVGIDEDYPLGTMEDETVEDIAEGAYGPLKVLCEKAVQEVFPENALIIRPGLIVGPYDHTDRFTYWPVRVARGGKLLAPVGPDEPTQFIHARDLADFTLKCIEEKATGVFNAVGPQQPCPFGELLETCKQVSGSNAEFVWASAEFIAENNVAPWTELPLWIPEVRRPRPFKGQQRQSSCVRAGIQVHGRNRARHTGMGAVPPGGLRNAGWPETGTRSRITKKIGGNLVG